MTKLREIIAAASVAARLELERRSFRHHYQGIYDLEITTNVIGWLGLNRSTNHNRGPLDLNPVIGVRDQILERMVATLCGQKRQLYSPPTISLSVGYSTPENTYRTWTFRSLEDVPGQVQDMVRVITTYGIPFMHAHASRESLIEYMQNMRGWEPFQYRLPVALWLEGNPNEARSEIKRKLAEMDHRDDPAADYYRRFAANALEKFSV